MKNKRHFNDSESSNSKRPQLTKKPSILHYFKNHYTYQTFNSKDLLLLLNCDTPETAKTEAESQMNDVLKVKNVKEEVRKFVSCLLIDDLKCLSDSNADLYWMEKKSMIALRNSAHEQFQVHHEVSSGLMEQALFRLLEDKIFKARPLGTPNHVTILSLLCGISRAFEKKY